MTRLGLATLVPALLLAAAIHHQSRWLVADGSISRELVADPAKWIAAREAFIRDVAEKHPQAALPVVYKLDEDFVAAARTRESIEVVDDCGKALCGVATDELREEWELADVRALLTVTNAQAAAILGRWMGEDPRVIAADIGRAGVGDVDDPLVQVPLSAGSSCAPHGISHDTAPGPPIVGADALIPRVTAPNQLLKGATISVVNRIEKHLIANSSRQVFARLQSLHFNAIALVPFAGSRGNDLRRFDSRPAGETDLSIRLAAARAYARGMQVMIKPHVWAQGGDATRLEPPSWEAWFASYRRYLVHEALLARACRAEWLSIGTELTRSESRPEWRRLIAMVRALYSGRITYSANFDAFERTPFWRELDAVGVDAYFPLAAAADATDAQLREGARQAVARLEAVAKATGRQVLLTELGYPSTPAPWIEPWREQRGGRPDPEAQKRAFAAMLDALRGAAHVSGFFVWKYESDPAYADPTGYLPKLPSERVLSH